MSKLDRPIEKAENAAHDVSESVKTLCPWLPDPPKCEACGRHMDALTEYVAEQAMTVPVWKCPECDYREYRNRD